MNQRASLYKPKVGDYLLSILLLCGCVAGVFAARSGVGMGTATAVISLSEARYRVVRLTKKETLHEVFGAWRLELQTEPGRIRVRAANCPKKDCVRQGWISNPSRAIVCLPARVVIRIEGERAASDVDAITE